MFFAKSKISVASQALGGAAIAGLLVMALSPAFSAQAPARGEPELVDRSTPANLDFAVAKIGRAHV